MWQGLEFEFMIFFLFAFVPNSIFCFAIPNALPQTLFDYRSEAWRKTNGLSEDSVVRCPTFNYVMPLSDDVIFFEETSLVANPAVSFQECKDRLTVSSVPRTSNLKLSPFKRTGLYSNSYSISFFQTIRHD